MSAFSASIAAWTFARPSSDAMAASKGERLLTLPGEVEIYPAHFSGSTCGAGMSGKPSSTLGFERRWSPLLSKSRDEFIEALCDVPPKPAAMERILLENQGRRERAP